MDYLSFVKATRGEHLFEDEVIYEYTIATMIK